MTEQITSRFSNPEELAEVREYRRFNFVAVLSLLLGLGSVASLLHLYVWILPCLGVFLGIIGLAMVRKSDNMGGRFAAWAGIALSLFFVSWGASSFYFQRWAVYKEAHTIASQWFDLVLDGEDEMAHQAMLHPATRQAVGLSVDDYYSIDEVARKEKDGFFSQPPASELLGLGSDAKVELAENITQDIDLQNAMLIRQVYRITAPDKEPIEAIVSITRAYKPNLGRATWIVAGVDALE